MNKQTQTSKNIIDKRKVAAYGLAWVIGMLSGWMVASPPNKPDSDLVQVVSTALDRGQRYWSQIVPGWRDAKVVLFTKELDTPCGAANAMTGPFYCPADEHIYLDLAFLRHIEGDFAQAYVIAHELGHHVQYITGGLDTMGYRIELQADCYAGIWMQSEMLGNYLESGDINEAYMEAAQVGDDGTMDTWTHGDSEHRVQAVRRGIQTGQCDL